MDLPGPSPRPPAATRAPASGLKLMLAVLVLFALLAAYGQWENHRRSQSETVTIDSARKISPTPLPNED